LRTGIEGWKNTGAALHIPSWNCRLAEALLLADVTDEAATVIEDALALAYKTGDVLMLAELHRLRGRLHVRLSRFAEAEAEFLRAREVGRRQTAKLFELRATSDLAQLWVDQGHIDRAASLLTPVFDSFTEGLDRPDLLQARHLLERLPRH
jgi:adenylate cyclase